MKKIAITLILIALSIPSISFAHTYNQNTNKEELMATLEERNNALATFLIENRDHLSPQDAQEAFFKANPQYDDDSFYLLLRGKEPAAVLHTVVIDSEKEEIAEGQSIEREETLTFYSDGTHQISTCVVHRDEDPIFADLRNKS